VAAYGNRILSKTGSLRCFGFAARKTFQVKRYEATNHYYTGPEAFARAWRPGESVARELLQIAEARRITAIRF